MVEFALMLVIVLALVVSMVWVNDLLNFDYWAQQEARYLAFEQTWVAREYYAESGEDPVADLGNSDFLRRPSSVTRLDARKERSDEGGLVGLLSAVSGRAAEYLSRDPESQRQMDQNGEAPVMLARGDSIWHAKTSDLIATTKEKLNWLSTAYASVQSTPKITSETLFEPYEDRRRGISDGAIDQEDTLENGIVQFLEQAQFGETFCAAGQDIAARTPRAAQALAQRGMNFSASDCAATYSRGFATHLAENVDPKALFRDFGYQVEQGIERSQAIEQVLTSEVHSQFGSFFDDTVRDIRATSVPSILIKKSQGASAENLNEIAGILADLRYAGTAIAVSSIVGTGIGQVVGLDPFNRDPLVEKQLQDSFDAILLADAPEVLYYLNLSYLPVPPTFAGGVSALQDAAMENVLRGGQGSLGDFLGDSSADESALIPQLIEDSNRQGLVAYNAGKGLFPAAARKFSGNKTLTANFFLVAEPWHITRKVSALGPFRDIGTQFDGIGEETEEGVLRRRVAGLWLFPSSPNALFSAIAELGVGSELENVFDVASGLDSAIASIKTILITDNPIAKLLDALSEIPFIGNLVPTFPKFPAVRPAAYPDSVELRGQAFAPDDEMTGSVRNFQDYVDEQNYNPEPNPDYQDSSFK